MAAIVTSDVADRRSVRTYVRAMSPGLHRIATAVTSAASRIAVPVADNQLRLNTAASAAEVSTTGGTRSTALSRPVTGNRGADTAFSAAFTCGRPHANTRTLRTTQGRYAKAVTRRPGVRSGVSVAAIAGTSAATTPVPSPDDGLGARSTQARAG